MGGDIVYQECAVWHSSRDQDLLLHDAFKGLGRSFGKQISQHVVSDITVEETFAWVGDQVSVAQAISESGSAGTTSISMMDRRRRKTVARAIGKTNGKPQASSVR